MSNLTHVIRPLAINDRDSWERMLAAYAEFYKTELEAGTNDRVWEWIHDEQEPFWCDVVVSVEESGSGSDKGIITGFTQYQLMHRSLSGQKVCYLSDLYVDPSIRGAGAGRALIDHVFAFAKKKGISNVRWLTQDHNYKARELYDSYGQKSDFVLYSFSV